ncbi:hypothetical protein TL16_g00695 [Triparma laevis f. inornata]|uniref:PHD-type domain-containing protein n=1 Tax=Triparma laevis f. inornata TaxID=1714386 RepID=A0A9W6ZD07_9STRA|nr:hypothetical protein TL16_g00695 [Triparma laevis f. inornata]
MFRKRPLSGCVICATDDDHGSLLVCEACEVIEFHLYCLTPRLGKVPPGKWLCPACEGREREAEEVVEEKNSKSKPSSSAPTKHQGSLSGFKELQRDNFPHIDLMFPASTWNVKRSYDGHYIFIDLLFSKVFYKVGTAKEYLQSEEYRKGCTGAVSGGGEKCFEEMRADDMILKKFQKNTSNKGKPKNKWANAEKIVRPKRGEPGDQELEETSVEQQPNRKKFKTRLCQPAGLPEDVESYVVDKKKYGDFCWVDPGGSKLFQDYESVAPYEDEEVGDEDVRFNFGRETWGGGGARMTWDMPLSWPAEIIDPFDPRVPEEIREVWEEKFMERKKGPKNERYIVRLLGPVVEGYQAWNDFIVLRSPDQIWDWDDGVAAGCVRSGLNYSGAVYENWGWNRRTFEDALGEAGWWGVLEKGQDKEEFVKELKKLKDLKKLKEQKRKQKEEELEREKGVDRHACAVRTVPKKE